MEDVDGLLADLARWSADSDADDAARSRLRERWLRQQAMESAHFLGVAQDLAEQGATVSLRIAGGRALHGRIVAVARDFCLVRDAAGTATFVALTGLAMLRPEAGLKSAPASSERTGALQTCLLDALTGLAGDRSRVRITLEGGGDAVTGELRSVGIDVATLRLDTEPPSTVYVRLPSIREVTILS